MNNQSSLMAPDTSRASVAAHEAFRREMLAGLCNEHDFDEIDEAVAIDIPGPSRTRSQKEISRVLSLLDELKGKECAR